MHAGTRVRAALLPAEPGRGIIFRRGDMGEAEIPARYDLVSATRLGTAISQNGASVGVIEHLMAAVSASGIDDLSIALDGPEPPILGGDALSWLKLIDEAGRREQQGQRCAIRILKRVDVEQAGASAMLSPSDRLAFDFRIQFDSSAIGAQQLSWTFSEEGFRRDIAPARTFGFVHELEALRAMGLANGASLDNTLAIDEDRLTNPEMQRFGDEFVRHKILDAMGDLALAGSPIIGRFEGNRSGHALNNALLRALFASPSNYELVEGLDHAEEAVA